MRDLFDEVAGQSPLDPHEAVRQSTRAPQRRRFYRDVEAVRADDGYHVVLDGKPIRTPARKIIAVPSQAIAEAVAAEWRAQADLLDPLTMPLTRLANSIVEGVVGNEAAITADIAGYFGSDLICYRAGHPEELAAREAAAWDGVLFWAAEALGAHFILTQGIVYTAQPSEAVEAARRALPSHAWPLAACHVVTTVTGSALLALALWHGARNAEEVWSAAHVDEDWNSEHWGVDDEVAMRRAARRREFDAAVSVIMALRSS